MKNIALLAWHRANRPINNNNRDQLMNQLKSITRTNNNKNSLQFNFTFVFYNPIDIDNQNPLQS
jgi:hypothetical protein